jgi:hypothetical protein
LIRLAPALIVSVATLFLGPSVEAGDSKAKPAPKPSAAPAKPAPASPAAPSAAPPGPGKVSEAEAALRERVTAYWKNRAVTNLHACYPFYESSFRGKYTADQFATDFRRLNRFAPEFLGIDGVTIDPSGAKARVMVKLRTHPDVLQGQELVSSVEDIWLLEDGVWNKAGELTFPNI